jgi:hypothetical protein
MSLEPEPAPNPHLNIRCHLVVYIQALLQNGPTDVVPFDLTFWALLTCFKALLQYSAN